MKTNGQALRSLVLIGSSWIVMRVAIVFRDVAPVVAAEGKWSTNEPENLPVQQASQLPDVQPFGARALDMPKLAKHFTSQSPVLERKSPLEQKISHDFDVAPRFEASNSFSLQGGTSEPTNDGSQSFIATEPPQATARTRPRGAFWLLARNGADRSGLLGSGEIGGSQMGGRVRLGLIPIGRKGDLSASVRASSPLSRSGAELGIGVSASFVRPIPFEIIAERRVALSRNGHDRVAVIGAIGVNAQPIGKEFRLDAYGQAGVVGLSDRALFAGGSVEVSKALHQGNRTDLHLGVGLWADAQRGAARIDIGPELTLRLRSTPLPIRVSAQWRVRIAGSAEPRSGPALVIGGDF
jgi:hypothetical protein